MRAFNLMTTITLATVLPLSAWHMTSGMGRDISKAGGASRKARTSTRDELSPDEIEIIEVREKLDQIRLLKVTQAKSA